MLTWMMMNFMDYYKILVDENLSSPHEKNSSIYNKYKLILLYIINII